MVDKVIILPYEEVVWLLVNHYQQVAVNAAIARGISLALHCKLHTLLNSCRNLEFYLLLALYQTCTVATLARILYYLALSVAGRADAPCHHSAKHCIHLLLHRACAVAGLTGLYICLRCGAPAVALRAGNHLAYLYGLLNAVHYLAKREFYPYADIASPVNLFAGVAVKTSKAAETAKAAETTAKMSAKDISKLAEDILH